MSLEHYDTVWTGTIATQAVKAQQRLAPPPDTRDVRQKLIDALSLIEWRTAGQLACIAGINDSTACYWLPKLIRAGVAERGRKHARRVAYGRAGSIVYRRVPSVSGAQE